MSCGRLPIVALMVVSLTTWSAAFGWTSPDEPPIPCAKHPRGDANCDGVVDRQDITDALKAIVGLAGSIDADVNRDGVVDEADMEEIRKDVEAWLEENAP